MSHDEERRARALEIYKKMGWGENEVVKEIDMELWEMITDVMFGEIWSRPGLSLRDRELITLGVLVADRAEGMKLHMRHAHHLGITYDEIRETIFQVMYYAGQSKGLFAMRRLKEVMQEAGGKFEGREIGDAAKRAAPLPPVVRLGAVLPRLSDARRVRADGVSLDAGAPASAAERALHAVRAGGMEEPVLPPSLERCGPRARRHRVARRHRKAAHVQLGRYQGEHRRAPAFRRSSRRRPGEISLRRRSSCRRAAAPPARPAARCRSRSRGKRRRSPRRARCGYRARARAT